MSSDILPKILNNILRILASNSTINSNYSNVPDEEVNEGAKGLGDIEIPIDLADREHRHAEYLWLLIIDLLIFVLLTVISYSSSQKLAARNKLQSANSAEDFKPKFTKGLVYANGVRSLSLIFIIILENKSGNDPGSWFNYVCHVVPAFVFVSTYMYLVTFLADLYYSNTEYNNHLAKPALLMIVVSSYIILALMMLITFVAQAFKAFAYSSEFLMAVVYMILGAMTIYYGEKISELFALKNSRSYDPSSNVGQKLRTLSVSIGCLFLLKSLCGLLTSLHIFGDFYPVSIGANIWDFFWFLVTEISPTVVFIIVARKNSNTNTQNANTNDVEMNESPAEPDEKYRPPQSNFRR